MVKRAVLFINGDLAYPPQITFRKDDFLIGVDGGTRLILRLGKKPDLIVGDFDSLPRPARGKILVKKSQNLTDTEFALGYCLKCGFKEVILIGVLGRRLDHLIANFMLAAKLKLTIIEGNQILYFVPSRINLEGLAGDLVSLIPLSDCAGVTTTGLKWCLQGSTLKVGTSRGLSNVMLGKKAAVKLKSGRLLVVLIAAGMSDNCPPLGKKKNSED